MNPLSLILPFLSSLVHQPGAGAAGASAAGTAALVTGAIPLPPGVDPLLGAVLTILGPVLAFVAGRLLSARAARKRSVAAAKDRRARELKSDADPANDAEARKLQDEADAERADADALEALKPPKRE